MSEHLWRIAVLWLVWIDLMAAKPLRPIVQLVVVALIFVGVLASDRLRRQS